MLSNPKILYIDDEEDLTMLAASFFEDENLPIETSTTFDDAVKKIEVTKYDLIISDARMPTGSGHDLFHLIKAQDIFHGKFVLLTGNADSNVDKHRDNYDLVLLKPIQFEELVRIIKSLL